MLYYALRQSNKCPYVPNYTQKSLDYRGEGSLHHGKNNIFSTKSGKHLWEGLPKHDDNHK